MTLNSTSMARPPPAAINLTTRHARTGGVKHQMKPMCQRSVGVRHGRCPDAVMTFFTYFKGRAKARRAGLCPAQVTRRDAEVTQGSGDLAGGESWRKPAGGSRGRANSGAAACRALRAEAHRARRCRRLAAPAP